MKADCYALIAEDVARFVDAEKARGGSTKLYLPEHCEMIRAVADMHELARRRDVKPGEEVTQLALVEQGRGAFAAQSPRRQSITEPDGTERGRAAASPGN